MVTLLINGNVDGHGPGRCFRSAQRYRHSSRPARCPGTNVNHAGRYSGRQPAASPAFTFPQMNPSRFRWPIPSPPARSPRPAASTSTAPISTRRQGFGPFNGGQLTINVPSLTFGPSAADNIQGPVTFNGGGHPNMRRSPADGGTFTVNATGAITVGSPIQATTGLQPSAVECERHRRHRESEFHRRHDLGQFRHHGFLR